MQLIGFVEKIIASIKDLPKMSFTDVVNVYCCPYFNFAFGVNLNPFTPTVVTTPVTFEFDIDNLILSVVMLVISSGLSVVTTTPVNASTDTSLALFAGVIVSSFGASQRRFDGL